MADVSDPHELSPRARRVAIAIWISFLVACVGTMFCFAFIAPDDILGEKSTDSMFDHLGVYTLGFFGLWLLAAVASSLTLYLSQPPDGRSRNTDE